MMVEDNLASFFKEELKGTNVKKRVTKYLDVEGYDRFLIDIVLDDKIAIEFKSGFDQQEIQRGIGQALLNLLLYDESWLAVPNRAVQLLKPLLEKIKCESLKVLDHDNLELYEFANGKVTSHLL